MHSGDAARLKNMSLLTSLAGDDRHGSRQETCPGLKSHSAAEFLTSVALRSPSFESYSLTKPLSSLAICF